MSVLDLGSGMAAPVMKVSDGEAQVWVGDAHTFAVIGTDGNACVCEVTRGRGGRPEISTRAITSSGDVADLRCVGGGIYFVSRSDQAAAYYSTDLRTITDPVGRPIH